MLDGSSSGKQECCGTTLIDTTQEYCCNPNKNLVGDGIDISSCSCVTSGQFTCEYKPDGDDYSIVPSKTAICRSHINKDNTIHYHNECIDNDKLGMAGPNDIYDDEESEYLVNYNEDRHLASLRIRRANIGCMTKDSFPELWECMEGDLDRCIEVTRLCSSIKKKKSINQVCSKN